MENKTKGELIAELAELRQRIVKLEATATDHWQVEDALQESKHFLQRVFNSVQDGISVLDSNLNIIRVNAWMEKMYALQMPLRGKKCYVAYQQRESPCPWCPAVLALETGESHSKIVPYPLEENPTGWIDLVASPLKDGTGHTVGVIEHFKDITARKQAEEALRESEEKLSTMLQSIGDHMSMMDEDLNIIWANQIARDNFGDDIIGKKCYEVYHRRSEPCEPYPCITLRAFQDGKVHEHNTEVTDKDGNVISFHCTANVALRDGRGEPTAVIEISRNVTERRQMESSIRKEQEFIKTALNAQNDIFFVFETVTERPVRWNKYSLKLTGYTDEELASLKVPYHFFEGEDFNKAMITIEHVLKKGSAKAELLLMCKDRKKIPIEFSASLIEEGEETPQYIMVVGRDITERKEAEELYRTFSEKTWTAVYVVQDGIIQLINSRGSDYVGYTPEELIGKKSISMIHPEDREMATKNSIAMLKGERISPYEFRVITKDGDIRWIIETVTSINYKEKQAVLGNSMDITERKIIEEALQQSEQKYRTLIDSTFDLVFAVDSRQIFTYINPRFEEVTGYSLSDLKGQHFTYVLAPEYMEESVTRFKRGMKGKDTPPYEADFIHKDGRRISVESLVITLYDMKGQATGRFGVGRDITERRQTEKALRESKEKYHSLVSTEDFMYLIDEDCRYLFMNEAYRRRHGLAPDEVVKKTYGDLHPEDHGKDFHTEIAKVFKTGESIQSEIKSTVDGRYHLRTMSPVRGEGGKITTVTVVSKDITKRKQAEEELERHREHLKLINQILTHDIVNDLAAVKSGLRLYKNSGDKSILNDINKKVDKSVGLIRDTKELESFISSQRNLKSYNVKDVIEKVIGNYSSTKFTVEGECQVLADEALGSVIDNIIRNAVDHGKTDRIEVNIDRLENFCEVRIADYGIGIPDKIKKRIFEEGFWYGGTGHTGLGLYIAKKAMESYGGSAHVEDNIPTGAIFVLKMKIVTQQGVG